MGFNPFRKKSTEVTASTTFFSLEFARNYLEGITSTDKKFLELYLSVPELQAIINYKARAFADMRIKAVNDKDEEIKIPQLDLLKKPNPLQNFKEFAIQYYVLRSIFGNEFIHPVFGKDVSQTVALWNLPPMYAEIIPVSDKIIPFNMTKQEEIIKEYKFRFGNTEIKYEPTEIIHFNDNQVRFNDGKYLLGDSKLRPLVQSLENIKSAYEARGILINNSALGILSNDSKDGVGTVPLSGPDKKQLQEDHKKYGLTKHKWQMILTNMSLRWQSMAVNVGKLKLFEEVDHDFRAIANVHAFPPEILQTDSTYENKPAAIKQLYQDAIIPEANEWLQGLGNFLQVDAILKADYSHVAALQQDLERRSKAINWAATGLGKAVQGGFLDSADAKEEFKKYLT